MPVVPPMARADLDPHSRRLYDHIGVAEAGMTEADVRVARHAYYGAVSYVDDQLGNLLEALKVAGFADNTIVIFLSDHGEALGERGLWFKRSFFDCALQVPMIVTAPFLFSPARRTESVSLVDLFPTVIDLADPGAGLAAIEAPTDGRSLRPHLAGEAVGGPDRVFAEMTGEGLDSPAVMIMDERFKYIHCDEDPPLLFDRAVDWTETENLAGRAEVVDVEARLASIAAKNWDLTELKGLVLESQARRRLIDRAHSVGLTPSWDEDTLSPGSARYFRPCPENPSASNYNSAFEVRARPDSEAPNKRVYP